MFPCARGNSGRGPGASNIPITMSTASTVPRCPRCKSERLRSTPVTRMGCYRVCNDCDHLWHVSPEMLRQHAPARVRPSVRK